MRRLSGVVLFIAAFVIVIGQWSNVFAQDGGQKKKFDWDIYGKLYFDAFYTSTKHQGELRKDGFKYNLLNFSKVGVNLSYDKFKAVIEMGTSLEALFRLLYVQYTFDNGGTLLMGQARTTAAYNFGQISGNQDCLIDYGTLNDTRRPTLRYSMHNLNISLVSGYGLPIMGEDESVGYLSDQAKKLSGSDEESVKVFDWLPKFELSYDINTHIFNGSVFGSFAPYVMQSKNFEGNYKNYFFNSFSIGFGGQFNIAKFYIQTTAYYGMNLMLTTNLFKTVNPSFTLTVDDNKLKVGNVQSAGGAIGFGYKINNMFTPQIGFGFSSSFGGPIKDFDNAWGMYANVIIRVNKWFALTPEIAYMDDMDNGNGKKQGNMIYAGAQLEVDF